MSASNYEIIWSYAELRALMAKEAPVARSTVFPNSIAHVREPLFGLMWHSREYEVIQTPPFIQGETLTYDQAGQSVQVIVGRPDWYSWLLETARAYPRITTLIGAEVSSSMVQRGREQAEAQKLTDRVEFCLMDALRMLEFPDAFFDLVNLRLGGNWLRTWEWHKLLEECKRVCRSGGVIRVTEVDLEIASSSSALTRFFEIVRLAFFYAGHLFVLESSGISAQIAPLLAMHGLQDVQRCIFPLEYRAETPQGQLFAEDMGHLVRTILPLLRKWVRLPDDYEALCQQVMAESWALSFLGRGQSVTIWGHR